MKNYIQSIPVALHANPGTSPEVCRAAQKWPQYNAVWPEVALHCNTVCFTVVQYTATHRTVVLYCAPQIAVLCAVSRIALQYIALCCNKVYHNLTWYVTMCCYNPVCCNTIQCLYIEKVCDTYELCCRPHCFNALDCCSKENCTITYYTVVRRVPAQYNALCHEMQGCTAAHCTAMHRTVLQYNLLYCKTVLCWNMNGIVNCQ